MGIELINEDEAETRLLASGDLDDEPDDELVEEPDEDEEGELTPEDLDEISRRIDDPVRMYLTQMGEIPLLTREQEIGLAKKIEITRKRFRRKVLECHFALALVVDVLKKVNERRAAVRPHGQGVGDREPREGTDPRADAAQPGDPRPPDGVQRPRLPGVRPRSATADPARRCWPTSNAAGQGGQPRRGALDPDPEGPAPDEAARAGLDPDGRAASSSSASSAPAAAARRTGPTSSRNSRT